MVFNNSLFFSFTANRTLALAVTGLVIMGFGVGAELVSGFITALQEAT